MKRQFQAIAKAMGVPLKELEQPVEMIKTLETRPGRKFSAERTQYVEPDVYVVKVGEEFVIQLNDDGLPRLRVSRAYRRMLTEMRQNGEQTDAQQYLKEKMRSAVWLIKSLDQRQRTIYKVSESILRQQRGLLRARYRSPPPHGAARRGRRHRHARVDRQPRRVEQVHAHAARPLPDEVLLPTSGIDRDFGRRHLVAHGQTQDPRAHSGRRPKSVRSRTPSSCGASIARESTSLGEPLPSIEMSSGFRRPPTASRVF